MFSIRVTRVKLDFWRLTLQIQPSLAFPTPKAARMAPTFESLQMSATMAPGSRSPFRHLGAALSLAITLWLAAPQPAAASLYQIDQRYGTIAFSVSVLGLFPVEGRFPQFTGELQLDAAHPENAHIDVAIDANAVEMPLADQVALLRSAPYFDTAEFPKERFTSTSIRQVSPSHFVVEGMLEIRGVTHKQLLEAVLQDHQFDAARGIETADFVVTGEIARSAFGMVAARLMLSDIVHINIRIRLTVEAAANAH